MRQVMAITLRELLILKRKFWRYAFSFSNFAASVT